MNKHRIPMIFCVSGLILLTLIFNFSGCNSLGFKLTLTEVDPNQRIITLRVEPSGFTEGTYSLELINKDGTRAATSPLRWSSVDLKGEGKILKLSLPSPSSTEFINEYRTFEATWMMIGLREGFQSLGSVGSYSELQNKAESLDSKAKSELQTLFRDYFTWEIKQAK